MDDKPGFVFVTEGDTEDTFYVGVTEYEQREFFDDRDAERDYSTVFLWVPSENIHADRHHIRKELKDYEVEGGSYKGDLFNTSLAKLIDTVLHVVYHVPSGEKIQVLRPKFVIEFKKDSLKKYARVMKGPESDGLLRALEASGCHIITTPTPGKEKGTVDNIAVMQNIIISMRHLAVVDGFAEGQNGTQSPETCEKSCVMKLFPKIIAARGGLQLKEKLRHAGYDGMDCAVVADKYRQVVYDFLKENGGSL